jgi:hypothetical protein
MAISESEKQAFSNKSKAIIINSGDMLVFKVFS